MLALILKFERVFNRMQCFSTIACTSNVVGVGGLLRGKGATS